MLGSMAVWAMSLLKHWSMLSSVVHLCQWFLTLLRKLPTYHFPKVMRAQELASPSSEHEENKRTRGRSALRYSPNCREGFR